MTSYFHDSVGSSVFPAVTLEAVMKGSHRSPKAVKNERKRSPLGQTKREKEKEPPNGKQSAGSSWKADSLSSPSTYYWQLKQCLHCGIPFNDHVNDRLGPLPEALQAAPPPPLHLPSPPSRSLRLGTRGSSPRGPSSFSFFPHPSSRRGSAMSHEIRMRKGGRKSSQVVWQGGAAKLPFLGEAGHLKKRIEVSSEDPRDSKEGEKRSTAATNFPPKRGPHRLQRHAKKCQARRPNSGFSCTSRESSGKGSSSTAICPMCVLVRQSHENFPISLKGEVLRPIKSTAAALANNASNPRSRREADGSLSGGGGGATQVGEDEKKRQSSATSSITGGTGKEATAMAGSKGSSPAAEHTKHEPYYHSLYREKQKTYEKRLLRQQQQQQQQQAASQRGDGEDEEALKQQSPHGRSSLPSLLPPPAPLMALLPHWNPLLDARAHAFTQDPTSISPTPYEEILEKVASVTGSHARGGGAGVRDNAGSTQAKTSGRVSSPPATKLGPTSGPSSTTTSPPYRDRGISPSTTTTATSAPPSLSPLHNSLLLGNPFIRKSISVAAAIANSGGPELRPGGNGPLARNAMGGRGGGPSTMTNAYRSSNENAASSANGGSPSFQRSLLHEIIRVQQAAEWLSACPLLTLRMLQQRVLLGLEDHLLNFLGTPWFMLPEKSSRSKKTRGSPSGSHQTTNSHTIHEEEDEEEEEESEEEPILPPPPLTFSSFLSQFILIEYGKEMLQLHQSLPLQGSEQERESQKRTTRRRNRRSGSSSRELGRRDPPAPASGPLRLSLTGSHPPPHGSEKEEAKKKTKKKKLREESSRRHSSSRRRSCTQRKDSLAPPIGGLGEASRGLPLPIVSSVRSSPTSIPSTSMAMGAGISPIRKSSALSWTILSDCPVLAASHIAMNGLLKSGRPPPVAPPTASNLPYGPQEELLYPGGFSVNRQRGERPRMNPGNPPSSVGASSGSRGRRRSSGVGSRAQGSTTGKEKGAPHHAAASSGHAGMEVGGTTTDVAFPFPTASSAAARRPISKKRNSTLASDKEVEHHLLSELMHWSQFFQQFFDTAHEGHCRDPMFLYAAILLACAAAGRRVLEGRTEAKLNREIARHCLQRPDTRTTHCVACPTLRDRIRLQWRRALSHYRDVLYASLPPRCATTIPASTSSSAPFPSRVVGGSGDDLTNETIGSMAALRCQEKEEEEACNMAVNIRFFLGTPTVVWWVVCFLQLYRTTSGGTDQNARKKANEAPSWWPGAEARKKKNKTQSGDAAQKLTFSLRGAPPGFRSYGSSGKGESGRSLGMSGMEEKGFRDTVRPGEVFAICDWIIHQAVQEEQMLEMQQEMGSVLFLPTSSSTNAKAMRVGFTKAKVVASVEKIRRWANEQVRQGVALEVQDLLLLLRREFPVVAYYSTFFDPPVTCRHCVRYLPKRWVVGKGMVFPPLPPSPVKEES